MQIKTNNEWLPSPVMVIVTCCRVTTGDDRSASPRLSVTFSGHLYLGRHFLVVTGRHRSSLFARIFSAKCSEPVVTIAPLSPQRGVGGQGWSGARRKKLSGFHVSSLVVTSRHWSSPVVTFWSSPVVTGRHFWSSRAHSKFIKIHKRSASPLRFSIAAAIQHRRCGAASAAGSGGSRIRAVRRRQRRDGCVKLRWWGLLQRRRRRGRRHRGPESGWWQARGSNLNGGGRGGVGGGLKKKETDQNG